MIKQFWIAYYNGLGTGWIVLSQDKPGDPDFWTDRPVRYNYWEAWADWVKIQGLDYNRGIEILRKRK